MDPNYNDMSVGGGGGGYGYDPYDPNAAGSGEYDPNAGAYYPASSSAAGMMAMSTAAAVADPYSGGVAAGDMMMMYGGGGEGMVEGDVGGDWQHGYGHEAVVGGGYGDEAATAAAVVEPGTYYPVQAPAAAAVHTPFVGDPITAVAYDDTVNDALFAATAALSMSGGRQRFNDHRASMLATHSASDGMLYSSVAGHPEAPSSVLAAIYRSIYGAPATRMTAATSTATQRRVPSHAYRPPFAGPTSTSSSHAPAPFGKKEYQMGINTLVTAQGYVASVSPAGIRLHAHGGMQVGDRHLEGMVCGTAHPSGAGRNSGGDVYATTTHLTVGGVALGGGGDQGMLSATATTSAHQLHCIDLWQDLRSVASCPLDRRANATGDGIAVTALATNHSKGSVVVGCSDGQVRLFDGRLRELAKIKSHTGGVVDVAVSDDGTLLASTGFSSRATRAAGSPLYGFPDPSVLVYDIRYLGRGGISVPFAGMRGGPRFLSFVPDVDGLSSNRLLIASGQTGGGLHIVQPFEDVSSFLQPPLERDSITSMCVSEDNLALGTSQGTVLQYRLAGYSNSGSTAQYGSASTGKGGIFVPRSGMRTSKGAAEVSGASGLHTPHKKQPLDVPPFEPARPPLSFEAAVLLGEDPNSRAGLTANIKSIFSAYVLNSDPVVSQIGDARHISTTSFGHLAATPMVSPSQLRVSSKLLEKATHAVDFLQAIPVSDLDVELIDEDHRPDQVKSRWKNRKPPLPNPNRLLYTSKLFSTFYDESMNRSKKLGRRRHNGDRSNDSADDGNEAIPQRYRLHLRPTHKSAATFSHAEMNETGYIPSWDYPPSMPNAFVPPVLMLLYLIPEMKNPIVTSVTIDRAPTQSYQERSLLPELRIVFHRIDNLSRYAMLFSGSIGGSQLARCGAWAPNNFTSCLTAIPEAEQLQILDGSPAAVDTPRRPEAFYRFLLYQIDKETDKGLDPSTAMEFVSINEFISGSDPPSDTTTRVMTVDLTYDNFLREDDAAQSNVRFGDVLQRSLCKETRLRAWSQGSKSYETIVQRKIAASLPPILSLSCACAGRKDEEGLKFWRTTSGNEHWLPEQIEVEIGDTGAVIVRELVTDGGTGEGIWVECSSKKELPLSISDILKRTRNASSLRKLRYQLAAVLSMVRDDLDKNPPELLDLVQDDEAFGHHILHMRVNKDYKKHVLAQQIEELEKHLSAASDEVVSDLTMMGRLDDVNVKRRLELAKERLDQLEKSEAGDEWVLFNGYVVSNTIIEDARAFHNRFKEPCMVVYRSVDPPMEEIPVLGRMNLPAAVMNTFSLTNGMRSPLADAQGPTVLPGRGDLVAFDAEFVSVRLP